MPDDRLFHKRLGHSEKVSSLTDFEDRVWRAYILSADDFGVMRFSAVTIQADHDYTANRPQKAVQRALERVHAVGLVQTFHHQGRAYCASRDWQNHQRVKHPRQTIHPRPPDDLLGTFTTETRELFEQWPGKRAGRPPESSGNGGAAFPHDFQKVGNLARAGARETANANANGLRLTADGVGSETREARAGAFCQWYEETHQRLFGVGYMGSGKDYQKALELVEKFTDEELRDGALVWFGMDDAFATSGTRTVPKFASRITGCLQEARARGIA